MRPTLGEIKDHLEIFDEVEDSKLKALRLSALDVVERDLQIIIHSRQIRQFQDSFAAGIDELKTPLTTIDAIEYRDVNDAWQTMPAADYVIKGGIFEKYGSISGGTDYYFYPEIELEYNAYWPDHSLKKNSVRVTYTAGFAQEEIPEGIIRGILITIATLYENRESLAPVQMHEIPAYEMACGHYRKLRRVSYE